jgi:hypothetical protein
MQAEVRVSYPLNSTFLQVNGIFDREKGPSDLLQRRQLHPLGVGFRHGSSRSSALCCGPRPVGSNTETVRPGSKRGAKPGASRRSACPAWPPCLEPELPGARTAGPWGIPVLSAAGCPARPCSACQPREDMIIVQCSPASSSALSRFTRSASREAPPTFPVAQCHPADGRNCRRSRYSPPVGALRSGSLTAGTKHRGRPSSGPV